MNERSDLDPAAVAAIAWAGGVSRLAERIGCSHTTVSFWLHKRKRLSLQFALRLQKASRSKFKAKEIAPEYF